MLILLKDCALIIKGSFDSPSGTKFRGTRMILQTGQQMLLSDCDVQPDSAPSANFLIDLVFSNILFNIYILNLSAEATMRA